MESSVCAFDLTRHIHTRRRIGRNAVQRFTCRVDRSWHNQMHPDLYQGAERYNQVHPGADCEVFYARCRVWWWWAPLPRSGASAGYLAKQRARRHGQARVCRKYRANVRCRGHQPGATDRGACSSTGCLQERNHPPALIRTQLAPSTAAAEKRPGISSLRHRRLWAGTGPACWAEKLM